MSLLNSPFATIVLFLCGMFVSATAVAQEEIRVDGLVLEHQKYSFTVRGFDRDYRVVVPNGTPLLMKLTMPEIDFERRQVSVELLVSAPDGDFRNNTRLAHPIPDPLYLVAEFADEASRQAVLSQGVRELDSYVLTPVRPDGNELAIHGQLLPGRQPGQYRLENETEVIPVQLGTRRGLLAHATINDLRPHETEVFVEGHFDGEVLVASRIRFQPVGDPFTRFNPALPNALVIGDLTSLNCDRALREELAGKVNVHHPPSNCGGSENWRSLHRWLANPDGDQRRWDVIVFNFGLQDETTSRALYTGNLDRAIETLKSTGARLVWTSTIPVPHGFPAAVAGREPLGLVQGRTELQNSWAADVLLRHPDIVVCDFWQIMTDNADGIYDEWWTGTQLLLNYPESQPLARALAEAVIEAAARSGEAARVPR